MCTKYRIKALFFYIFPPVRSFGSFRKWKSGLGLYLFMSNSMIGWEKRYREIKQKNVRKCQMWLMTVMTTKLHCFVHHGDKNKGGSCLMRISLLRFFKKSINLPYAYVVHTYANFVSLGWFIYFSQKFFCTMGHRNFCTEALLQKFLYPIV